jgi:hypothetical protein
MILYKLLGKKMEEFWLSLTSLAHNIPVGLGLLCALLNWEHIFSSFGGGKHFPWVRNSSLDGLQFSSYFR